MTPPPDPTPPGPPRVRLADYEGSGFTARCRRAWRGSWGGRLFERLADVAHDAWYPQSHPGLNRVQWMLHRWRAAWDRSLLGRGLAGLQGWLLDVWYPPTHPGLNRIQWVGRRVARGRPASWFRWVQEGVGARLHQSWQSPRYPDKNRLQAVSMPLQTWWQGSRLRSGLAVPMDAVYEWWHPVPGIPISRWALAWERRQALGPWLLRWQTLTWLLPLVLLAVWGYRDGRPWIRQERERRATAEAQEFFTQRKYREAVFRARRLLDRNPTNLVALRILAEVADRFDPAQAVAWRERQVAVSPGITNQLALAATALRSERFPYPIAAKALEAVAPEDRSRPQYQRLAAALAAQRRDTASATEHLAELVRLEPNNAVNQWSLALARLGSTNAAERDGARSRLVALADHPEVGLQALRPLVADRMAAKDLAGAERLSGQILTNAQAVFADRITHLQVLAAARSERLPTFLVDVQGRVGTNAADGAALMDWMNRSGRAREALDWEARQPVALTQSLRMRMVHADAFLVLERWPELEALLTAQTWRGMEPIRHAMIARAASRQSKHQVEALSWRVAVSSAATSLRALQSLAVLARDWGWPERFEEVLWQTVESFPGEREPRMRLFEGLSRHGDAAQFLRFFNLARKQDPQDIVAGHNYARCALLLDRDLDPAHRLAERAHAAVPTNALYAATHALSLLKQGRTADALAVWASFPPGRGMDPSIAVYRGLTLAAAGDRVSAQPFLAVASKAEILPEARALVAAAQSSQDALLRQLKVRPVLPEPQRRP